MFLDLPSNCKELVYDKLHVRDRIALNMALPRSERIVRTAKTCAVVDKRLAIVAKVVKRQPNVKIGARVLEFLTRHRDDPTVLELVREKQVVLPSNNALLPIGMTIDGFKNKICGGGVTSTDIAFFEKAAGNDDEIVKEMCAEALRWCSVADMNVLLDNARMRTCIWNGCGMYGGLLSTVLTFENEALFVDMLCMPVKYGYDDATFRYDRSVVVSCLGTIAHCRTLVWKHVLLTDDERARIVDALVEAFDCDGLLLFMELQDDLMSLL